MDSCPPPIKKHVPASAGRRVDAILSSGEPFHPCKKHCTPPTPKQLCSPTNALNQDKQMTKKDVTLDTGCTMCSTTGL